MEEARDLVQEDEMLLHVEDELRKRDVMARYRAQGWHRAFEKSFSIHLEAEQQLRERRKQEEDRAQCKLTTYLFYVDGKIVHECQEWFEAHDVHLRMHGISEWSWLPKWVCINGVPKWGVTPQMLEQDKKEARRYKSNRTRYLNQCGQSEQEREERAQEKLARIVAGVCSRTAETK